MLYINIIALRELDKNLKKIRIFGSDFFKSSVNSKYNSSKFLNFYQFRSV